MTLPVLKKSRGRPAGPAKSANPDNVRVRLTIEFPPDLFERVKSRAEKNYSTCGSEIRRLTSVGLQLFDDIEKDLNKTK